MTGYEALAAARHPEPIAFVPVTSVIFAGWPATRPSPRVFATAKLPTGGFRLPLTI